MGSRCNRTPTADEFLCSGRALPSHVSVRGERWCATRLAGLAWGKVDDRYGIRYPYLDLTWTSLNVSGSSTIMLLEIAYLGWGLDEKSFRENVPSSSESPYGPNSSEEEVGHLLIS